MPVDLFGNLDLDEIEAKNKKKRRLPLVIQLKLGKVCVGKYPNYVCRSVPYSPNFLNRKHWAVRSRWKKAWEEEIWGRWQEEKKKWTDYEFPMTEKALVTISIFCLKRQDEDNTYASMKGVIDGLVQAGILKDDSYDYVSTKFVHVPVTKKEAEHIEITITKYKRK